VVVSGTGQCGRSAASNTVRYSRFTFAARRAPSEARRTPSAVAPVLLVEGSDPASPSRNSSTRYGGTLRAMSRPPAQKLLEAAVNMFNKNPWTSRRLELVHRSPARMHRYDGLWTYHGHDFVDDRDFQRAYERGVQALGWDYGIPWRVHVLLWAAGHGMKLDGVFVECGTARGFQSSAICEYYDMSSRAFFLFDTFRKSLRAADLTGEAYDAAPATHRMYADSPEDVAANFAEWPTVQLVPGNIPDTLRTVQIDKVAFLAVDLNAPEPEEAAVRYFWPRLSVGAMLVLDDYAFAGFEASRASADRVARDLGFSILSLPTGQGLAIKQ
jgi:hypothetical protein